MRQKIIKLRRLQREADGRRRELGINPPGEVTWRTCWGAVLRQGAS